MSVVTIHEAKTHLSKLIQRALEGEEIIIAKRDEPLVKLQVLQTKRPIRRIGGCKDLVISMGDNFNEIGLDDFSAYWPSELGDAKANVAPKR